MEIITLKHITKKFPGVVALDNVSITLETGKVHALMGENGAGKSSLIKIIAGLYKANDGEYLFAHKKLSKITPKTILDFGVQVVFQELSLIEEFSVAENLSIGSWPLTVLGSIKTRSMVKMSRKIFHEMGFDIHPRAKVKNLTIAQKQIVEIARAISREAKVIVMDEPTSSLNEKEIILLLNLVKKIRSMGIAVLYVSHKINEIFENADEVTVLRDGKHISHKEISEHTIDSLVFDMVGRNITSMYPQKTAILSDEIVFSAQHISNKKLHDISFDVKRGEVVGFYGLMGAGRTELAKAITGNDPIKNGRVTVMGTPISPLKSHRCVQQKLGLLSEDRKLEGIFAEQSMAYNITIASLEQLGLYIKQKKEHDIVTKIIFQLGISPNNPNHIISLLSGGNQQKAVVGRWLVKGLKVLVMDEPTRGIDVGGKSDIFTVINQLTSQGMSIIIMSSEILDLLGLCHRIFVLKSGGITGSFDGNLTTQEEIFHAAV